MSKIQTKTAGFTLIEVILVLAIGGLIFLLAFLAFRQVSSNRRDSQRRQDTRRILAEAETFASDNNGNYPCSEITVWQCNPAGVSDSWNSFRSHYATTSEYKDPRTNSYTVYSYSGVNTSALSDYFVQNNFPVGTVIYSIRATCEEGRLMTRATNEKSKVGIWIALEKGDSCVDNS